MDIIPHGDSGPYETPQQEAENLRDKYGFETDEMVDDFSDEPPVDHDVFPDSDDDEYEAATLQHATRMKHNIQRGSGYLYKGQQFFTAQGFKEAVLDHALREGRNLKQVRWDTNKCACDCVGGNCSWRVYCSVRKGSNMWEIKILNRDHSCVPNGECEMLKSPVIARLFVDKIRQEPDYFMPMKIEELIKEKWKLIVSRTQCQDGRLKALDWIEKEYEEQFKRLRDYKAELLKSNPNSTVDVETLRNEAGLDLFNRFYVCFDVLRKTWKTCCRKLIGVDGCHLRGKMKGQFLVALGRDGDNAIYPIAWAVVQVENIPNWVWFIKKIKADLNLNDGEGYVMVSDRQKGLIRAVEEELPQIEHRMCVRHIYANLKSRHGRLPELKPMIWTLAWSYNEADYRRHLKRILDFDPVVYEDVLKTKPKTWVRAFQKIGSFCEDVENNSTESFNATIVKAREKPLVPMLDLVARLAMVRIFKRSVICHDHLPLVTPYAQDYLKKEHENAANCRVHRSTNNMFQVILGGDSYRVCLEKRSCSCRKWDITGIPCEHGYGVILQRNLEVEDFVVSWFSTEKWRKTYADGLVPIQGYKFWPTGSGAAVHMPPKPPQPGRNKGSKNVKRKKGVNESPPKKREVSQKNVKRKKGLNESPPKKREVSRRSMHCGICGEAGHNSRSHKVIDEAQVGASQGVVSQGERSQGVVSQGHQSQDQESQVSQV